MRYDSRQDRASMAELAIGKSRERFPKVTTFREGKRDRHGNTNKQVKMLYEMIGVVCLLLRQ